MTRAWFRDQLGQPLLRTAYSLIANVILTAGLGVGFWIAAARLFDAEDVGRDSALISAMSLISSVAQLNLGNALLRFLPGMRSGAARALGATYAITGALSLVLGVTAAFALPEIGR